MVWGSFYTVYAANKYSDYGREEVNSIAGVWLWVSIVYIFYPSGAKYFKKREYQKGVDEFEYIKKIILVGIAVLSALLIFSYITIGIGITTDILAALYSFYLGMLTSVVVGGFLRIALLIIRKEFRFYFAKGCINIIPNKEEFEQMHYLRLGLDSYNKYLRRRFKYQISENNIRKFYFKYIRATSQERNEMINSLLQAFEDERLSVLPKPVICISTIMKVPETEEFLTDESVKQKLKVIGALLGTAIPIIISVIGLLIKFQK